MSDCKINAEIGNKECKMSECKTLTKGKKIGYIKINCDKGQVSYSVRENDGSIIFFNLRYHSENIKPHNIIFYNVIPNYMTKYSKVIREYNEDLVQKYFDKNIDEFIVKISNYGRKASDIKDIVRTKSP